MYAYNSFEMLDIIRFEFFLPKHKHCMYSSQTNQVKQLVE